MGNCLSKLCQCIKNTLNYKNIKKDISTYKMIRKTIDEEEEEEIDKLIGINNDYDNYI